MSIGHALITAMTPAGSQYTGIGQCIQGRKPHKKPVKYDKRRHKCRNRIEIIFVRPKDRRKVATRYQSSSRPSPSPLSSPIGYETCPKGPDLAEVSRQALGNLRLSPGTERSLISGLPAAC